MNSIKRRVLPIHRRKKNHRGELHPDRIYFEWVGNGPRITPLNQDGTPTHDYINVSSRSAALAYLKKKYPGRKIVQSTDMFVVYPVRL